MRVTLIATAAASLLTACGGGGELARFAELRDAPTETPSVAVAMFLTSSPRSVNRPMLDALRELSPEGQAAAIKAFAGSAAGAAALRADLVPPPQPAGDLNLRQRAVRLVTTVEPFDFGPADRIEELIVSVELPTDGRARFLGWKGYSDESVTIDLGSVTATETSELKAGVGADRVGGAANVAGAPSLTLTPSVAVTLGQKREEAVKLTRVLQPVNTVTDHRLSTRRFGAPGRDLVGSTTLDVVLTATDLTVKTTVAHLDLDGGTRPASQARVSFGLLDEDPFCNAVPLTVSWRARIRQVLSGADTWSEADDVIRYRDLTGGLTPQLLTGFCAEPYRITDLCGDLQVAFQTEGGPTRIMVFETAAAAQVTLDWAKRQPRDGEGRLRLANGRVVILTGQRGEDVRGLPQDLDRFLIRGHRAPPQC